MKLTEQLSWNTPYTMASRAIVVGLGASDRDVYWAGLTKSVLFDVRYGDFRLIYCGKL